MSKFNLPPEQEKRLRALGEPIATFRSGLIGLRIATMIAFVLGLVLIAGMPLAIFWGVPIKIQPKDAEEWEFALVFFLSGFGLLIAGAGGVRRIRTSKGLRVFAFRDGLARVQGDAVEVLRWQDITLIQRAIAPARAKTGLEAVRRLNLRAANGKMFEFDDSLSGLKRLRQLVEQYTLPHLFPSVLKACQAGSEYVFGVVKVNSQGLIYRDSLLPWALCAKSEVVKGVLIVKKQGGWVAFCKVPLSEVPNVHVLIAFAEYVRKHAD